MSIYSDVIEPCVLCDTALSITAQATIYQLQLEIKRVVEALPFVRSFYGFEASEYAGKKQNRYRMRAYADEQESNTLTQVEDALACTALHSKEIQLLEQADSWLCFIPVKYGNSVENLWVIECEKLTGKPNLKHVCLLVDVYQNCASHIGLQNTDPLTGLFNRQALSDRLDRTLKGKRRSEDNTVHNLPCICLLDIDFFKRVNDDYGHLYGDEVLLLFSGLMKDTFRENDFLYRYGGEEFIVLLDVPSIKESLIALERFRLAVDTYDFPQVGHITVSIGFVHMHEGDLPSSMIDKADKALYYSKENGRNQVNYYKDLIHRGLIKDEKLQIESELF